MNWHTSLNHPLLILALFSSLLVSRSSVSQPIVTGPDRVLDAKTRTAVIQELSQQLHTQYVFPNVATQIQQVLQTRMNEGRYDQITSSKAFADTVTAHMQQMSQDKHLRLFYHNKPSQPPVNEPVVALDEQAALYQYGREINFGIAKVDRLAGNIGYLRVDEFMPVNLAAETVVAAMTYLTHTDALILDVRYNRGGEPAMVAFLASYFFGPEPVHVNDIIRRGGTTTQAFWTQRQVTGQRYVDKPLYILTSHKTFSAGEEFAYDLQTLKRAMLVGEPTAGGAHSGEYIQVGDHFTAFIPVEYACNPITHTNWEGTGVKPDLETSKTQALKTAYLAALETLLAASTNNKHREDLSKLIEQAKTTDKAAQYE